MKRAHIFCKLNLFVIVLLFVQSAVATPMATGQSSCLNNMASPIANFCEVMANKLWRGAKPDKETSAWLINQGVKTIINLELLHDDLDVIRHAGVNSANSYTVDYFRVKTWEPLYAVAESAADQDVIHFLAVARQAKKPVYVHCRAGENRTGVMVAAYKIVIENNTSDADITDIISEMQSYKGFWSDATTRYIKGLAQRRDEIIRAVDAYELESPTTIGCHGGKCESAPDKTVF